MDLIFDIETNGLLDREDLRVLCLCALDVDTGREWAFTDKQLHGAFELLGEADLLIGHNISGFDIPVLDLLYPGWRPRNPALGRWYDTQRVSQQVFTDMVIRTYQFRSKGTRSEAQREARFPRKLIYRPHSLAAWGYRLGEPKDDYLDKHGVQEECSPELIKYCLQDLHTNKKLYDRLRSHGHRWGVPAMPMTAAIVESQVGFVVEYMTRRGVRFNRSEGERLYAKIQGEIAELTEELRREHFPPWFAPKPVNPKDVVIVKDLDAREEDAVYVVPKRSYSVQYPNPLAGREKGCAFTPVTTREFSPTSDHQVADRLMKVYGWQPDEMQYNNDGHPSVADDILSGLDFPCIPTLVRCRQLSRVAGLLGTGKESWLNAVGKDGIIHHRVMVTGCRTSRMSHSKPNLAQVPGPASPYGLECRDLFSPINPDAYQVGVDASGQELRCLAHRLGYWDGGAFGELLLQGDPHSNWQKATGLYYRDSQKTGSYAYLYGAGDLNLGMLVLKDWRKAYEEGLTEEKPPTTNDSARDLGKRFRQRITAHVPGLEELQAACKRAFKRGYVVGLDGRVIQTKTDYGVTNDVLQSDGAIVMKHALVMKVNALSRLGIHMGEHWFPLLNVHDEWQDEAIDKDVADIVAEVGIQAIRGSGELLEMKIALDGAGKIGRTWRDTH